MFRHNEPFGLARGTVRALLVLEVVTAAILLHALTGSTPEWLQNAVNLSLGGYLIQRAAQAALEKGPSGPPQTATGPPDHGRPPTERPGED